MYARNAALWAAQPPQMSAEAILMWRAERDLSQQQVADLLGLDRKTISRWECDLQRAPLWFGVALRGIDAMRAMRVC